MIRTIQRLTPLAFGVSVITACSTGNTGPNASQLRLSFASRAATAPGASAASLNVTSPTPGTFSDGSNTLVLSKVQLVLRKIELRRVEAPASACDASMSEDASASGEAEPGDDHGHDGENESCEEVKVGPVLFDVPVTSAGAKQSLSIPLDAGTYSAVEFKIHEAEAPADQTFLNANPTFAGKSIHVEGTWNGTPVTFDTDLTAKEELTLQPPVTLSADGSADITIFVDVHNWFTNASGGLVDPASANQGQPNEALVAENIRHSFHAFEDENEDGKDDHGSD